MLHKRELKKLQGKVKESGLAIIPVRVYINDAGLAKVEIALSKGKKTFDKRDVIKDRDVKRELDRLHK